MKTTKLIILLLLLITPISLIAQKKGNRTIHGKNFVQEINYLEKASVCFSNPYKMYYWMDAGKVHQTQGEFKGKLLHGEYEKCDQAGNLIEKGNFKKGLKVGVWKQWFPDGKLKQISNWKLGVLHGKLENFNHGKLNHLIHFKNGRKHGVVLKMIDAKLVITAEYRNGILIESPIEDVKKEEPEEVDPKLNEQVTPIKSQEKDTKQSKESSTNTKQK